MRADPRGAPPQFIALRLDSDILDPFLRGEAFLPFLHLLFARHHEGEHFLLLLGRLLVGVLFELLPCLFREHSRLFVRRFADRRNLRFRSLHLRGLLQKLSR